MKLKMKLLSIILLGCGTLFAQETKTNSKFALDLGLIGGRLLEIKFMQSKCLA